MRGSIQKRGERTWRISVELERDPETGRRRRIWETITGTKRDAESRLAELVREVETGIAAEPNRLTVADWLRQWLEMRRPRVRPSTWERYRQVVEVRLIPALGSHRLQQLRPMHVEAACARWEEEGLAPHTIRKHLQVLHRAFEDAVRLQLAARNAADHVERRPAQPAGRVGPIAPGDIPRIVAALREEPAVLRAAGFLLLYTGMRRGEALGLEWRDVDLETGILTIQRTRLRVGSEMVVGEPKTAAGRRVVPLHPVLAGELSRWRRAQAEERLSAGAGWAGGDYVLAINRGPLSPWTVSTWWRQFARTAGVAVRLHDLRHTAATLMAAVGVPPRVIAEILGHSRASFTLDVYAGSPDLSELRRGIAALGEALERAAPSALRSQR